MKAYMKLALTGVLLAGLLSTVACGSDNKNNDTTTTKSGSSSTTSSSTTTTKESTSTTTTMGTTETTSSDTSTPFASLPDIDDPMTDVEPNIPESGVGGSDGMNGSDGDMGGMNGTDNGMGGSDGGSSPIGRGGARGRSRRDMNRANPALPTH